MGVKRLKRKVELNYRRGPASGGCRHCNHVRRDFPVQMIGGELKGLELRCDIIGFKGGRAYRIHPDNICDRFDNSRHIARLTGALA